MLGTVTLLFSALGGWLAGILADRYGRVRVLQYTILWFSVCTVAIGFAQNFEQLFVLRALQGLGFGGEWAVGSVLMGEIVRASIAARPWARCRAAGRWAGARRRSCTRWPSRCCRLSGPGAACSGSACCRPSWCCTSASTCPSEVFQRNLARQKDAAQRTSFWAIFSPALLKTTVVTSLLCTAVQGGYYAITTWLPTFLKTERNLSVLNTGGYLLVIILGSFCGYIVGAYLADRLGRRANLLIFSVLSAASVYLYTQVPLSNEQMLVLGFPLGFAASGIFSGIGAYLTELFPSSVRATGQGFATTSGAASVRCSRVWWAS